ncbi:hypothetical protein HNO88_002963 [Novosphingobium chloroacetimidivorans]|uniref:Uncharacterized protein n=1 Tax=Novosphingobium chloroacetimidivorans TaxID=1428314 RepID=A0A7W7KB85_9SPHN|nr:hypothetical protein [Novosphingobium chloroacetimidivorans]MBB4859634.1 hypothetical protein [Novosphingobium chloroacetimidivorans]
MPEPIAPDALAKIIDAFVVLAQGHQQLADEPFFADRSPEDAVAPEEMPAWVVFAEAWDFEPAMEQGQTRHQALINFERLETSASVGVISRANRAAIAHLVAAIHSDRTLGGRLEDTQELNVAPPLENGRSVGGASLQVAVTFYTPRGHHFTIVNDRDQTF